MRLGCDNQLLYFSKPNLLQQYSRVRQRILSIETREPDLAEKHGKPTVDNSPSPLNGERAGVRGDITQIDDIKQSVPIFMRRASVQTKATSVCYYGRYFHRFAFWINPSK